MLSVNLKVFFDKEAKTIIASYKSLLTKKQGVSLDPAPKNAPATIRKKGKDHWLVDTGETRREGFAFITQPTRMVIYASGKKHSGRYTQMLVPEGGKKKRGQWQIPTRKVIRQGKSKPTYRQIFRWHNQKGYSGIFGKLPVGSGFPKRFVAEVVKQLRPQIAEQTLKRIRRTL